MLPNNLKSFTKHIIHDHKYVYSVIQPVTHTSDKELVNFNICTVCDKTLKLPKSQLEHIKFPLEEFTLTLEESIIYLST